MGDVAATNGCRSAPEGTGRGRGRAFLRAASGALLASCQTLSGLAWLAGRVVRVFGGHYGGAAMARLAGRPRAAVCRVPRIRNPG
jgi:hypothetical protein